MFKEAACDADWRALAEMGETRSLPREEEAMIREENCLDSSLNSEWLLQ